MDRLLASIQLWHFEAHKIARKYFCMRQTTAASSLFNVAYRKHSRDVIRFANVAIIEITRIRIVNMHSKGISNSEFLFSLFISFHSKKSTEMLHLPSYESTFQTQSPSPVLTTVSLQRSNVIRKLFEMVRSFYWWKWQMCSIVSMQFRYCSFDSIVIEPVTWILPQLSIFM